MSVVDPCREAASAGAFRSDPGWSLSPWRSSVPGIWNGFLLVPAIASPELTKSFPVGVYSFSGPQSTQSGRQPAALVIAVLPVMSVYFAFNRRLTQGVVAGAIEG